MMKLTANGKEYKIKFGYNCFCDTDLMDRVSALMQIFDGTQNDSDAAAVGKLKDLFLTVRELLFVGFSKYNAVEDVKEVGEILDSWMDEETEEERGILKIFNDLTTELFNEGFLAGLMNQTAAMQNGVKAPTDHKRK